jgi:hypothetical protein
MVRLVMVALVLAAGGCDLGKPEPGAQIKEVNCVGTAEEIQVDGKTLYHLRCPSGMCKPEFGACEVFGGTCQCGKERTTAAGTSYVHEEPAACHLKLTEPVYGPPMQGQSEVPIYSGKPACAGDCKTGNCEPVVEEATAESTTPEGETIRVTKRYHRCKCK